VSSESIIHHILAPMLLPSSVQCLRTGVDSSVSTRVTSRLTGLEKAEQALVMYRYAIGSAGLLCILGVANRMASRHSLVSAHGAHRAAMFDREVFDCRSVHSMNAGLSRRETHTARYQFMHSKLAVFAALSVLVQTSPLQAERPSTASDSAS
jgi:hypothetical protein